MTRARGRIRAATIIAGGSASQIAGPQLTAIVTTGRSFIEGQDGPVSGQGATQVRYPGAARSIERMS
jgi:hypothetical protein